MQNSGPWDSWLPVVKNSRLFAQRVQRTVRPQNEQWEASEYLQTSTLVTIHPKTYGALVKLPCQGKLRTLGKQGCTVQQKIKRRSSAKKKKGRLKKIVASATTTKVGEQLLLRMVFALSAANQYRV